ncbi:MAG: hypothetical protein ABW007_19015 [Chitinophagaceae bacterium]
MLSVVFWLGYCLNASVEREAALHRELFQLYRLQQLQIPPVPQPRIYRESLVEGIYYDEIPPPEGMTGGNTTPYQLTNWTE